MAVGSRRFHQSFMHRNALAVALASVLMPSGLLHARPSGELAELPAAETSIDGAKAPVSADGDGQIVDINRVSVSASRINRPGFDAPTPTTSINAEELQVGSRPNVAATLNDLPSFKASSSPQTQGTNQGGARAPVDLRGLGSGRTLVLIDGKRFKGDDDLNTIPSILISNVDVVTGGASAAWGSGAVGGVVNIGIDEALVGARLQVRGGISDYDDAEEQGFAIAAGSAFADGRGHIVFGADYYNNDGIIPKSSRPNIGRWARIANGDGSFTTVPDVGMSNVALGGLITSGVLAGKAFNPDGTLRDYDAGQVYGTSGIGGESPSEDDYAPLTTPQRNYGALTRVIYDATDNTRLTAQFRYFRGYGGYRRFGDHDRGNLLISADNAFLNDAIKAQLAEAGETSFRLGRFNHDFAWPDLDHDRRIKEFTVGVRSRLGDAWSLDAYYTHAEYNALWSTPGFLLAENYAQAVDSVIDPSSGNPVCRVALSNPSTDCVPINLFGWGAPSDAATRYVLGHPWRREAEKLDVAGISTQGDVAQLPAGTLAVTFGLEARRESVNHRVSESDAALAHRSVNYAPLAGRVLVREAFAEALIPLFKEVGVFNKLDLNLAARYSHYDTSGPVWQWKGGLTNEFFPGFKGRISRSRDVRAPSISELFRTGGIGWNNVIDPVTQTTVYATTLSGGNTNLDPETSDTATIGVSWSPESVPGLSLSLDYFSIEIQDVITSIGVQEVLNRCYNGNQALCANVFRNPDGTLDYTYSSPVNLAEYATDGVDIDIAYTSAASRFIEPLAGRLNLRLLGTWVNSLKTDDGLTSIEYVRSQGDVFGGLGVPRLRLTGIASYQGERFGGNFRARYISSGNYNNTINITNNAIGSYTYFDVGLTANVYRRDATKLELYASVNNAFDKEPPVGSLYSPYYDVTGRYYTLGLRATF